MFKVRIFIIFFIVFLSAFYVLESYQNEKENHKKSIQSKIVREIQIKNPIEDSLIAASKRFYYETLIKSKFNGGILIARNNKILFEAYNGLERLTTGKQIDTLTSFHLASTSKTFTAVGILKLFDSLAISIDLPVKNFITNFPSNNITVRQLLNHRSGLPNYVYFIEKIGWRNKISLTNDELLNQIIVKWKLLKKSKPNSRFEYSNTNYAILASIIERISKKSFSDFMDDFIFKRLGMNNSFVFSKNMNDFILPSFKSNGTIEPMMFLDEIYGDKNIYSTTKDLLKWDNALNDTSFLSLNIKQEAFKGYSYETAGLKNYGLGWRILEYQNNKKIIFHNGWWHGNNIVFNRLVQDGVVIIVLGNQYNSNIYKAIQIAKVLKGYERVLEDNQ